MVCVLSSEACDNTAKTSNSELPGSIFNLVCWFSTRGQWQKEFFHVALQH